ncbi:30S ribosomal protein S17 [Candidatus Nanohalobium constans]|uniref:30S ribosomal protein S17 n=1 Tax=Candidatus Nanohalobium constans TaxID=2565781 RepID=A0A5Q0UJ43_9ARCH|nr:30S ribosomal protein S17 [Candidatus Nanohalobium constans]QGA80975.1 30S ribosomal protein S17 [Candidatus Nanohalobium constans]
MSQEYEVRGGVFTGRVISNKMQKSATVRWEHTQEIPKYERKERRNTKITVHVPEDMELEEGDTVKVGETRPISKTKSHVVMEKIEDEEQEGEE